MVLFPLSDMTQVLQFGVPTYPRGVHRKRSHLLFRAIWVIAVWAAFGSLISSTQGQTPSLSFQYSFDMTVRQISLSPTNHWGFFQETDDVGISTRDNTPIRVYRIDGSLFYQGAPLTRQYPRGHYFVETAGDRTQFAVLPDGNWQLELMGTHDTGEWDIGNQLKAALRPSWERLGAGQWRAVQPAAGTWDWTVPDGRFAALAGTGRKVIYLGAGGQPGFPDWLSRGSSYSEFTNNLVRSYTNYMAAALARYSGKIYAWEVWNEPMPETMGTTNTSQYVEIYLAVAKAAKVLRDQKAPGVKLLGPSWHSVRYGDNRYLRENGINDIVDIWSIHDYELGEFAPDQNDPLVRRLPDRLQATYSAEALAKPLIVGELGLFGRSALGAPPPRATDPSYSTLDWHQGMVRAIKNVVLYKTVNVVGVIPHMMGLFAHSPDYQQAFHGFDYGAAAPDYVPRGPHPRTSAFLMACYWLEGATLVDYRTLDDRLFLYTFQRPGQPAVLFAWAKEGASFAITGGSVPAATDVYGRALTPAAVGAEPILFSTGTSDAAALLTAVMDVLPGLNRPPDWEPISTYNITRGELLTFTVAAPDPDNDPLTYTAAPLPAGATVGATTGEFTWRPGVGQVGTYHLTFTARDARGLTATTGMTVNVVNGLLDNLSQHWRFNETSGLTAFDSVGSTHGSLVNHGAANWVAGREGGGIRFGGNSATLDGSRLYVTNNFTISVWLKPQTVTNSATLLAVNASYGSTGLRLWNQRGNLVVEAGLASGWQQRNLALNALTNGVWQHVALVCDRGVYRAYVNGEWKGSVDLGSSLVRNPGGNNKIGYEYGDYYRGDMDDLLIIQRPLTAAEVVVLAGSGSNRAPVISSPGNKTVNENSALSFTVTGSDPDGNALTYAASGLPGGASFNAGTRTFAWTPGYAQSGSYNVTFTVSDGSLSASTTITITVNQVDTDGDGVSNSAEMAAGTDSNNPTSYFTITSMQVQGSNVVLSFRTVAGKKYRVQSTSVLQAGSWSDLPGEVLGTGLAVPYTDVGGANFVRRYYRVRLVP